MENKPQHILSRRQKILNEIESHEKEIERHEKRINELRSKITISDLYDALEMIKEDSPYIEIKMSLISNNLKSYKNFDLHFKEFKEILKEPVL